MSSAICFNFDQSKILSSGNGLKFVRRAKNTLSNANSKNFILFPEYLPRSENTARKGENAGHSHFCLFQNVSKAYHTKGLERILYLIYWFIPAWCHTMIML